MFARGSVEGHQSVGEARFARGDGCFTLCDANGDSGRAPGNGDGNHEGVVAHEAAEFGFDSEDPLPWQLGHTFTYYGANRLFLIRL